MPDILQEFQSSPFADKVNELEAVEGKLFVKLNNDLVRLLSEQLYQSPAKAIEELVVNAYDAEATECRIYVPVPTDWAK